MADARVLGFALAIGGAACALGVALLLRPADSPAADAVTATPPTVPVQGQVVEAPRPTIDVMAPENDEVTRERYVEQRARELAARSLAGMPPATIDELLERETAFRREQAGLEWAGLQILHEVGRELVAEQPERMAALRAAFDGVWSIERDLCGQGAPVNRARMRGLLLQGAEKLELERR